MDLAAISSQLSPTGLDHLDTSNTKQDPARIAKVSKQFESILLRQFLSESMKPLLQDGPSGQVYGYFLTDSLANEISDGGGIGLAHIIQSQISHPHK